MVEFMFVIRWLEEHVGGREDFAGRCGRPGVIWCAALWSCGQQSPKVHVQLYSM
jgi:hypothetical protein